jgi:hypothetical protein
MTIANTGCIAWNTPTVGTFSVTVTAQDTKTGLTGQGVATLSFVKPGPVITATSFTGVAGKPLNASITITDPTAAMATLAITGCPAGMGFQPNGGNVLQAVWTSPVTGTYSIVVTLTDSQKLTTTATIPLIITAH